MGVLSIDRVTGPPGTLVDGSGRVVAARCHVAVGRLARAVGLLGTAVLGDDEALLLARCRSVHTVGMRYPIGCVFVDGAGRVMRVVPCLAPWRSASCRGAVAVVEAGVGTLAGVRPGMRLEVRVTCAGECDFPAPSAQSRAGGGWFS